MRDFPTLLINKRSSGATCRNRGRKAASLRWQFGRGFLAPPVWMEPLVPLIGNSRTSSPMMANKALPSRRQRGVVAPVEETCHLWPGPQSHIDFVPAGLARGVGDPTTVWRKYCVSFPRCRLHERKRFFGRQQRYVYLFLDGVSLRVRRPSGRKQVQMLVAYGRRQDEVGTCWPSCAARAKVRPTGRRCSPICTAADSKDASGA